MGPIAETMRMRVAVAKDLQAQIRAGAYRFRTDTGFIKATRGTMKWLRDLGGDLQQHADAVAQKCNVCFLGGLLLSKARLYNHAPVPRAPQAWAHWHPEHLLDRSDVVERLADVFDQDTLGLLEYAFEASDMDYARLIDHYRDWNPLRLPEMQAKQFGYLAGRDVRNQAHRPAARAWAAAENLIRNRGEFLYTQEPRLKGFPHPLKTAVSIG